MFKLTLSVNVTGAWTSFGIHLALAVFVFGRYRIPGVSCLLSREVFFLTSRLVFKIEIISFPVMADSGESVI